MSDREEPSGPVRLPATQRPGEPIEDRFDAPAALLRLLVGGILVGADELRIRLYEWEAATRARAQLTPQTTPQAMSHPMTVTPTSPVPRRYALIGMLFESEARVRQGLSTARARLERLTSEADSYVDDVYASDVQGTPLDSLLTWLDDLSYSSEETIDRWAARGRNEAEFGSQMARVASSSVVEELLDYMARNPEVRAMIAQQASTTTEIAVDEVRERTATADQWIERLAHKVLRRPGSEMQLGETGAITAPQPAVEARATSPSIPLPTPSPDSNAPGTLVAPSVEPKADSGG